MNCTFIIFVYILFHNKMQLQSYEKDYFIILHMFFSIYAQGRNFLANEKTNGTSTIDSLFSSVNKQLSGYPSECIYLQTSKGIYEAGEDLWFKAYQLDVQTFGLSDKSKTLYLQMINPKDSVVWQEKYQDGIANGIKGGIIIGENIGKY